jgi:hypothetical protein
MLQEGEDFYYNQQGLMVLTEAYHLRRGYCCKSGCLHCPYGFRKQAATTTLEPTDATESSAKQQQRS